MDNSYLEDLRPPVGGESVTDYLRNSNRLGKIVRAIHALHGMEHVRFGRGLKPKGLGGPMGVTLEATRTRGGAAAPRDPWTPFPAGTGNALEIKVRTGVVNASVVPVNRNAALALTDDADNYVYLACTLALGVLVDCEYATSTTAPTQPDPEAGEFPSVLNVLLAIVPCADGVVQWGNVEQLRRGPITLATVLHDFTGTAPDFVKSYRVILRG